MRNVTYFLRTLVWCIGVQKEDRVCIEHANKDSVKGPNGMQQGKSNDNLQIYMDASQSATIYTRDDTSAQQFL